MADFTSRPDRRSAHYTSSGFFFDVEKWFGSVSAQRMSFAEKGVYLVMLFQQWRDRQRSLPDDANAVADLIAVTDQQVADVLASWETVRRKFITSDRDNTRIFNVAIERTRRAQAKNHRARVDAGRKGGLGKAAKPQTDKTLGAKHCYSIATATPSDKTRQEETREEETRPDEVDRGNEDQQALVATVLQSYAERNPRRRRGYKFR